MAVEEQIVKVVSDSSMHGQREFMHTLAADANCQETLLTMAVVNAAYTRRTLDTLAHV